MTSGKAKDPARLINMSKERWAALADIARAIVPDSEKPPTANVTGNWERNALLRAIADGKVRVEWVGERKEGE
jgi:hypothetical protein